MYPNGNPGKVPIVLTRPLTRFSLTRLQPSKSIVINRQEKQSLSIKVVSVTHAVFNRKNAFTYTTPAASHADSQSNTGRTEDTSSPCFTKGPPKKRYIGEYMEFFSSAIGILQTLVTAIGAGLGVWGIVNLLEGYGNDNPGAKSQGIKQLMAGGGVALIGTQLIPLLANLF